MGFEKREPKQSYYIKKDFKFLKRKDSIERNTNKNVSIENGQQE
jgi:hypothetical protein